MGEDLTERRFGETFKGPRIPFGSLVEHYSHFCKRPIETPPIREERLAQNIPRIRLACGR